jgi:hypothetical protein
MVRRDPTAARAGYIATAQCGNGTPRVGAQAAAAPDPAACSTHERSRLEGRGCTPLIQQRVKQFPIPLWDTGTGSKVPPQQLEMPE